MTVKRFFGESAREALRKVKAELGPEAIVISNKPVAGGVEIMAMSADSLDALSKQASAAPPAGAVPPRPTIRSESAPGGTSSFPPAQTIRSESAPGGTSSFPPAPPGAGAPAAPASPPPAAPTYHTHEDEDYAVSLSAKARAPRPFQPWQPWHPPRAEPVSPARAASAPQERVRPRPLPPKQQVPSHEQVAATLAQAARELDSASAGGFEDTPQIRELLSEMQSIKAMLERQLAGFAWGEMTRQAPIKAQLLGEMLEAGFSGLLSRRLVEEMPENLELAAARKWLIGAVNRRLRTLSAENDLIDRGGVFALVGPTGVGKTTTTAKLAARCVVRYGAEKLALLTTDGYRIGAHEQLRIYGRILGVPVHVVRDGEDLRRTLADLSGKHMVLIDTVGMSQRDRMVAEQAAMLMRAGDVRRLLLLNATSRGDTLDDVIRNYAGEDIAGCILTKVDETASLAPALDAVVRHGLLLAYVANGQRVPEDLHLPNRNWLLHRAFKQPAPNSVHRLKSEEIGLLMPARLDEPPAASRGGAFV
ncbi:MAG: flagellar biosynthesis protein FlhF [Rhodocyclaceae bacterium]|nr:flagellar biosynthesis protein FlhF [Rhodocyclaceae bacterium]